MAYFVLAGKIAVFLNNKALEVYKSGEKERAIFLLKKSLKIKPSVSGHYNLACMYADEGLDDAAIIEYKKALMLDPQYIPAYEELADIYKKQGNYTQALSCLKKMESLRSNVDINDDLKIVHSQQVIALFNQAVVYYNAGDTEKAIADLNAVLGLDSDFAPAYKALGIIYSSRNELKEAIVNYKKAVELGVEEASLFNNLGLCYMHLEKHALALRFLKKAQKLDPDNLHISYGLASTLRDNEEIDEALGLYKQIVNVAPDYPNIHNDLAGIYEVTGRKEDAQSEYKKEIKNVKARDSDDFALERLAQAYNGLGEYQQAKALLDRVIKNNPTAQRAYYVRAQVYEKLGQREAAENDLKKAEQFLPSVNFINVERKKMRQIPAASLAPEHSWVADVMIFLKNGSIVRGRIKEETDARIVLEIMMGNSVGTITFRRAKIERIKKIR